MGIAELIHRPARNSPQAAQVDNMREGLDYFEAGKWNQTADQPPEGVHRLQNAIFRLGILKNEFVQFSQAVGSGSAWKLPTATRPQGKWTCAQGAAGQTRKR